MSTPNTPAVILEPAGGERITVGASNRCIKAASATTGGTVFMSETELEPGFPGPPPTPAEMGAIASRYDFRPAPPPES